MTQAGTEQRVLGFLKRVTSFSNIDKGKKAAESGLVAECYKTSNKVNGLIREEDGSSHTVSLDILSGHNLEPNCTCGSGSDEWCHHAVALIWAAKDLGFLSAGSGFATPESFIRLNQNSPNEIAKVIEDVKNSPLRSLSTTPPYNPVVTISLQTEGDRLGVQVLFDGAIQAPVLFEDYGNLSDRSLDNILIHILEDEGAWDADNNLWYVSQSESIEKILGLVQEYKKIVSIGGSKKLEISHSLLDALLTIEWHDTSAELFISWILPDGSISSKKSDLIGTGPFWTFVGTTLYKLSPLASRIASIFPHSPNITLSKAQTGPILDALSDELYDKKFIKILNPELQPGIEIKDPVPCLELRFVEPENQYGQTSTITIGANLTFEYPLAPSGKNVVYLPCREKEHEYSQLLQSLGFTLLPDKSRYIVSGDNALDFVSQEKKLFASPWKVKGLDSVKKNLRFSELSLHVAISESQDITPSKSGGALSGWFDCHLALLQNNANVPLSTLFKNTLSGSDRWVLLDSGAYARVPGGGMSNLRAVLGVLDSNYKLSNTIKKKISSAQALSFARADDRGFTLSLDGKLRSFADKLTLHDSIPRLKASKGFKGKLRSYQQDGLSWLHFLHDFGLCGILADEMGLGKTIQTLALIQLLKDSKSLTGPTLVIAPTSVITNWFYEAKKFTPDLKVLLLHGPTRKVNFNRIGEYDIVLTSYALLRIDRQDLERHKYHFVILDEAQNIKNPEAATTKAAKKLRSHHRLALTGTPTENRPLELWSIMEFLMPSYLGSQEFFKKNIEKPILEGGPGVDIANFLNSRTKPFLLRRTKAEVEKDLPPKVESVLHVDMTQSQSELYLQILEEVRPKVFDAVEKKGMKGATVSILAALLRLRQVCNHPNSIDALKDVDGFDSGKFNLLKELVEEALESGRKILLFGQFIEMLSIIRRWLDETNYKNSYLYMDGSSKARQQIVDRFNNDPDIRLFVVSLKTGGTGLNLTAADTVIIYDPWWNPAVEDQATDRAHRIGQTKKVNVYKLVTENSVEQRIMDLKAKKAKIVDALINNNGLSTINLSRDDLEKLFAPYPSESD